MVRILVLIGAAILFAGLAAACPDASLYGERYTYNSDDLYSEKVLSVTAGGGVDLDTCYNIPGTGNVIQSPDFSIQYNKTQQYDIRFIVDGQCDTVLLINDANGNWHFDDDSAGDTDPRIMLSNAADGWIDVWIGTYGDSNCAADLRIESFNR